MQTEPNTFDLDQWRQKQADKAERYHDKLARIISKKEAATGPELYETASGRRNDIRVTFAPSVKSWHYRTYTMHWATFCALMNVAYSKDKKEWCDALTLAELQPDGKAGEGYACAEAGNVNGMDIVGLDYDKGHLTRAQLEERVRASGLEAIVMESYSYGITQKTVTVATLSKSGDHMLSKLGKRAAALDMNDWHTISGELVKTHLVEDEGYSGDALGTVEVVEVLEDVDEDGGARVSLVISHDPLPKLRVFVLLDQQLQRASGENNDRFKARYMRDVYNPIVDKIAPHSDPTCSTLERRWYVRGHRPDHKPVPPTVISGQPFSVFSTPDKIEPAKVRVPKGQTGGAARNDWKGFLAADAAAELIEGAADKRGEAHPLVSVDCPFREFHDSSKNGRQQLMIHNAAGPNLAPVVKCLSGSCQGHGHTWEDYLAAVFGDLDVSSPEYWLLPPDSGSGTPAPTMSKGGAVYQLAADVEPKQLVWFARDHFALGTVALVVGDTGVGKSQIGLHLAACATKGKPLAEGVRIEPAAQGKAIVVSGEDALAAVVRPRIEAAGADLHKVIMLQGFDAEVIKNGKVVKERMPFSLEHAKAMIVDVLEREEGIRLVVIDPVNAFLGGNVNSYVNAEVRAVLMPLVEIAEKYGILIVLIHHNAKDKKGKGLTQMVGGSNAWVETARTVWMAVRRHPDDTESVECVLEHIKTNNGKMGQRYAYEVEGAEIKSRAGETIDTSRVVVSGEAPESVAQIVRGAAKGSKSEDAKDLLTVQLAKGPKPAGDLIQEAADMGISESTLARAKTALGVKSDKDGMGGWLWSLPDGLRPPVGACDGLDSRD